jgi:1-deoxy-D-xylulose-5-phosphate reductoisomerase
MNERKKKGIAILGSTGSIGCQSLEVIAEHNNLFEIEVLTANNNSKLLIEQAKRFIPNAVVIGNTEKYAEVKEALTPFHIKVYAGNGSANDIVQMEGIDLVIAAMVGIAGLEPTMAAIEAGKPIALANKETLVVAGKVITELAQQRGVNIYPIDSEHSAIFQCLAGEFHNPIEKIILTASGGPFRGKKIDFLETVTKEDALKHPNWDMGAKITIDSATLMNKGLEAIEAKWLFGLKPEQIEVLVHPQSIIHSMVQFHDGSIKSQMGLPDMKLPILYALSYPDRLPSSFERMNFDDYPVLSFERPDFKTFPCLRLAYEAMKIGGNAPCVLNAANEVAVEAFLNNKISFTKIPIIIEKSLEMVEFIAEPDLSQLFATDNQTRSVTNSFI